MPETAAAGATPVVDGATPSQSQPATTPAATQPGAPASTATDDYPEGLGDAGKRALDRMKAERDAATAQAKAAERERDELKAATLTDTEKAIADAKKAGAAEVTERYQGQIRRAEVRSALTAAGISPQLLDLAIRADEFAALKVTDDGAVSGLEAAVEAFRKGHGDLFAAKTPSAAGDAGLGPRGTPAPAGTDMNSFIRRQSGRA